MITNGLLSATGGDSRMNFDVFLRVISQWVELIFTRTIQNDWVHGFAT